MAQCLKAQAILKTYRKDSNDSLTHVVSCGKCPACLQRRRHDWAFRMEEEHKRSLTSAFLTLTYQNAPKSFNGFDTLDKRDFQLFMKRFRKKNDLNLKYYVSGEYGDNFERPHYHAIVFNLNESFIKHPDYLAELWKHGIVEVSPVTIGRIKYVTKYISKGVWKPKHDQETGLEDDREPQFSLMSKNIGKDFLSPQMANFILSSGYPYLRRYGQYIPIPRYYKKIMSNIINHKKDVTTEQHEQRWESNFEKLRRFRQYQELVKKSAEERPVLDISASCELERIKYQFEKFERKSKEYNEYKKFKYQKEKTCF